MKLMNQLDVALVGAVILTISYMWFAHRKRCKRDELRSRVNALCHRMICPDAMEQHRRIVRIVHLYGIPLDEVGYRGTAADLYRAAQCSARRQKKWPELFVRFKRRFRQHITFA